MKIDSFNRTITIDCFGDEFVVHNYLYRYLTKDERKGWKIIVRTNVYEKGNGAQPECYQVSE